MKSYFATFRIFIHFVYNTYRHLNPGGVFIFNVFYPDLKQLISGIDNHIDFEGEYEPGKKLKRTVTTQPDIMNQIIDVEFVLEWEEDNSLKNGTFHILLRYYFKHKLEHLIQIYDFNFYNTNCITRLI